MTLSTTSATALANPYIADITLAKDFLSVPNLSGLITDSHFSTRDRMGRLVTFMARIIKDGWAASVKGIGVEEGVAIGIDQDGIGTVYAGAGIYAYPTRTTAPASVCLAGTPLSIAGIETYKIGTGAKFDFNTWTVTSGASTTPYTLTVNNGVLSSSVGSIY
jgi:cyanophycinase